MIATHNIKVNGRWVQAGEEYQPEKPEAVPATKITEEPVKKQEEKPVKEEPKVKATSTRRKKVSE